jgi:hypothetical protein
MSEATSGGFNDPPSLGGGARAVVVWCGVSGGLAKKMAVALVVQGGGVTRWSFYRGATQACCARTTPPILFPIRMLSQGFSIGFEEGGKILISYNLGRFK